MTKTKANETVNVVEASDEALLAALGYKQELKRDFSPLEVFGFGFSIIGVLPGIASVIFYSVPYGGPVAMVWGWATCCFFLMFIAMAMAELGSAAPTMGGVYYWTYKFSSPRYRNYLCWLAGYINTLTYISAVAGVNWGCAVQILAAASIGSNLNYAPTIYQTYGLYVGLVLSNMLVCSVATKVIARLQYFFIATNIAICAAVIIGVPAATPDEFKNNASYAFGHLENLSTWPNGFAFILSFLAPLWVVGGFDSTVHISEEARNANVAIPWAIMTATGSGCVLGWAINVALAFNMGSAPGDIISSPTGQPLATIFLNSFGQKGALGLWTFIILAQYMTGVSVLTTSSRQIFAFSRDGALPFSRFLYNIHPTQKIPMRCVWASGIVAILIGMIALGGAAASGALFTLGIVGQYLANSLVISARWLGGHEFVHGPFNLGAASGPVSFVAVAFMFVMVFIFLFPAEPEVAPMTMNYTVVVFGGVLILATIYYWFPRYGGVHWFKGPVTTIRDDDTSSSTGSDRKEAHERSRTSHEKASA